jgi:hypothetical protein
LEGWGGRKRNLAIALYTGRARLCWRALELKNKFPNLHYFWKEKFPLFPPFLQHLISFWCFSLTLWSEVIGCSFCTLEMKENSPKVWRWILHQQ